MNKLHLSTILQHYKRKEIQEEIIYNAKDREVAIKYQKGFGKRPDTLQYPQDILELARKGSTSFHASEELWSNPLRLNTMMKKKELDKLRIGWDLVLDIDCQILNYSKIAADLVIKALRFHNIKSVSCKFSGNKGFHIGIPFEAFPSRIGNEKTSSLFPEAARRIALYLKNLIKKPLGEKILELEKRDFSKILEKTGTKQEEVKFYSEDELGTKIPFLDVEPFLDIDTILISSRHLYRMPYTFNEKSGLISIPVDPDKILDFNIKDAKHPVKISNFKFLDKENVVNGEAKSLIVQAFDFNPEPVSELEIKEEKKYELPENALPVENFPPCMRIGLKGLADGRKRFLFSLTNFLVNIGWDYDEIEKLVNDWNKRNDEPLSESYVKSHLNYHKKSKKRILSPNCDNTMYYVDMRICQPDSLCVRIKNPINYTRIRSRFKGKKSEKHVKKLSLEEQQQVRRKKQEEKKIRQNIYQD